MSEDRKKSTVTVRIAGEEHTLRSSADPEYTRACAAFLDERIREIRELSGWWRTTGRSSWPPSPSPTGTSGSRRAGALRGEVASRSTNLARRIEEELGPWEA
jgi:hypothetical protein